MNTYRTSILYSTFAILIVGAIIATIVHGKTKTTTVITNFAECAAAGYPIAESFPERCTTPDGQMFTNQENTLPSPMLTPNTSVSLKGTALCLPHRVQGDVMTLECAYGFIDTTGKIYALYDPTARFIPQLPFDREITLGGKVIDSDAILYQQYAIDGTIQIETVEQ